MSKDLLVEFLEVAFHGILYYRKIYPEEIFEKQKLYGIGIWVSQHPDVNEYIDNVLVTIKEIIAIADNSIKCVNFSILDSQNEIIEKFVFDLFSIQGEAKVADPYFRSTEESLRTICLKLSIAESYLKPLPEDVTFNIEVETCEEVHDQINKKPELEHFPWIIKESQPTDKPPVDNFLLPLHSVKTEHLGLQVFAIGTQKSES
ncbi:hypothetical protein HCN44_006271 [Aphidius gifuensis]|uniref:HORMA domain-containing protein n=1 Tax=Aphidius gifuensis TaxID=684658 RepID=A0A834XYK3_APHGI|nr:hypothetical protein HCN44_006271 [Aphidius gifuensis]